MARSLVNEVYKAPGLSDFVDNSSTISVPYTSIVNRAKIPDIANDLSVRMGVERISIQSLYQLQNEFGVSGEPVWAALNDDKNLIRLVGSWGAADVFNGPGVRSTASGNFIEIVFYGTGLNLLVGWPSSGATVLVTVDGGTEGVTNIHPTGHSGILNARSYAPNGVIPVVSNLSLGVHTVRLRHNSAITWDVHGFEILNAASTLVVNPGVAYSAGSKKTLASQQTPAFNSGFTNVYGIAGTRGGRVLTYLASDGTVKKDIQYVNTAAAYLSSASHADEEVIRTYHWREFGAGRSGDDFSRYTGATNSGLAFTLDDGTTTLVGYGSGGSTGLIVGGSTSSETLAMNNVAGTFITLTFVGTGLDIFAYGWTSGTQFASISIDGGASIGSPSGPANGTSSVMKIVSGLPYGTHTVKFSASGNAPGIRQFIVYGPKKPALPMGAVELADYNMMADFSSVTSGLDVVGSGVLRKASIREFVYSGSGFSSIFTAIDSSTGWLVRSATNTDSYQYTFFGTGFDFTAHGSSGTTSATLSIDGPLYTGSASATGTATWTPGTSTMTFSSVVGAGRLRVTGLALGTHTIKFTITGAQNLNLPYVDIITPIHSPKSNLVADLQNTLPVGSCAISDNRKTSAIKESLPVQKAWAQAVGVSASPSTGSTSPVPMPDMSTTVKTSGGRVLISYSTSVSNSSANNTTRTAIYVNGILLNSEKTATSASNGSDETNSDTQIIFLPAGTHKIDVYWWCGGGTSTASGTRRNLIVAEL